jgi:hypothetical protein
MVMSIIFAGGGMDVLSLDQEVGAWDSVLLDPLTEDSFIANLHQRFKRDHIYVSERVEGSVLSE